MMTTLRLRSTKARLVAALVAVAVVGGGALLIVQAQEGARPEVQLATVTRARITRSVIAVGDIEARDRHVITLSPSVKVTDVLVAKGQRVSRGDVLAVVDTREFESQLEQQGISLADAESTLRHLAGPNATTNNAAAQNAVSQAQVALDGARAAEDAARRHLADVPGFSDSALRQAEIALEGAERRADAAWTSLDSARTLNGNAVRQAGIALDAAERAVDQASRDLADLRNSLLAGLITQAEYDARCPALRFALDNAESARRSAEVALESARVTADGGVAVAEQAASDADLAVASAEATLDAARLSADAEFQSAQQAVSDAQRAVRSAQVAVSTAQSGATAARANDTERVANQDSRIALLDATIRALRDKVEQGQLRASVAGVVSRVDAVEDQYPQLGDSIVVEGALGYVASVDVAQSDSVSLRPGLAASVTLKGIGTTFAGSVAAVSPVAETSATSADQHPKVAVEVSLLDPDTTLRVGYEADVEILLEDKDEALKLSVDAVRRESGSGRPYAWVVDDRNRLGKAFLRTGIETADEVEVLSGLAEGQHCVVDPDDSLTEGATVRVAR